MPENSLGAYRDHKNPYYTNIYFFMKTTVSFATVALALGTMMLSSCDTKIDVSDIDTTVRLDVDSLVVPLRVDNVCLQSLIDTSDRVEIGPEGYVFTDESTFTSAPVSIPGFTMHTPAIEPTVNVITRQGETARPAEAGASAEMRFPLKSTPATFGFTAEGVTSDIYSIQNIGAEIALDIKIELDGISGVVNKGTIENLKIAMPMGLQGVSQDGLSYNPANGILSVNSVQIGSDGKAALRIQANGIDCQQAGLNYTYATNSVSYSGMLSILEGDVVVSANDMVAGATLPTQLTLTTTYVLEDVVVKTFTGDISYEIKDLVIPEIDLTDLPDFINQGGTNIWLANPQIYLSVRNPLNVYGVYGVMGMMISSYYFDATPYKTYYLDPNASGERQFEIGRPNHPSDIYKYCLSPEQPATMPTGYENAQHVGFKSLQQVLGGPGIPLHLKVWVTPAKLPRQTVQNLPLGKDFGCATGSYKLYAPMALVENSAIVYRDTIDGWDSEDLKDLTITKLDLHMDVTSDIPLEFMLSGVPVGADGKAIDLPITCDVIQANANNQHVHLTFTGPVTGVEGIAFRAQCNAKGKPAVTLSPDMTIILDNIRPAVSGYYRRKL